MNMHVGQQPGVEMRLGGSKLEPVGRELVQHFLQVADHPDADQQDKDRYHHLADGDAARPGDFTPFDNDCLFRHIQFSIPDLADQFRQRAEQILEATGHCLPLVVELFVAPLHELFEIFEYRDSAPELRLLLLVEAEKKAGLVVLASCPEWLTPVLPAGS